MHWALLLLLGMTAPLSAHELLLIHRIEGDRIRVEAFFDDDSPAQAAKLKLQNATGQLLAEAMTDDTGIGFLPRPEAGVYSLEAENLGHRAIRELIVPSTEVPEVPKNLEAERQTATATPWLRLSLGLLVIAGGCLGLRFRNRKAI